MLTLQTAETNVTSYFILPTIRLMGALWNFLLVALWLAQRKRRDSEHFKFHIFQLWMLNLSKDYRDAGEVVGPEEKRIAFLLHAVLAWLVGLLGRNIQQRPISPHPTQQDQSGGEFLQNLYTPFYFSNCLNRKKLMSLNYLNPNSVWMERIFLSKIKFCSSKKRANLHSVLIFNFEITSYLKTYIAFKSTCAYTQQAAGDSGYWLIAVFPTGAEK